MASLDRELLPAAQGISSHRHPLRQSRPGFAAAIYLVAAFLALK
jgi:hypothetical protein